MWAPNVCVVLIASIIHYIIVKLYSKKCSSPLDGFIPIVLRFNHYTHTIWWLSWHFTSNQRFSFHVFHSTSVSSPLHVSFSMILSSVCLMLMFSLILYRFMWRVYDRVCGEYGSKWPCVWRVWGVFVCVNGSIRIFRVQNRVCLNVLRLVYLNMF